MTNSTLVRYLPAVANRERAVEEKLKQLHGSFFGRQIVKFDVAQMRDVWVPYCYLTYEYSTQSPDSNSRRSPKTGEIVIVYDINETHPFQFDVYEDGHLSIEKGDITGDGRIILSSEMRDMEICEDTENYIKYKIMIRTFGTPGVLRRTKLIRFFRPAVEIEVVYKEKNSNLRYAWLDQYGIQNEHVSGIKYRLNHKG